MIDAQVVKDYKDVNDKFLEYDWFVSPYYTNSEFTKLKKFAQSITSSKNKERMSRELASELMQPNMNYHFRAVMVYEGYRLLPHMAEFSHFIEMGLLEFYRLNFITCLGIWVPSVEGIIRSIVGTKFDSGMPNLLCELKKLKAKLDEEQQFLDAIANTLSTYITNVFYKNIHKDLDLTLADNFNRHIFSHGTPKTPLYCRDNCIRLLNIFDSLLAIDSIITEGFRAIFNGDPKEKEREEYYELMVREALSNTGVRRIELLKDHRYFDEKFYFGN